MTREQFLEPGKYFQGQSLQFPQIPRLSDPTDGELYDVRRDYHDPPTWLMVTQNMQVDIRQHGIQFTSKPLRYLQMSPSIPAGYESG